MCSKTRGPAKAPSLVTCPTNTTAVPVALAMRVRCAAHSRTCATEPGALVSWSEYTVWMESITTTAGCSLSTVASTFSSCVSASTCTCDLSSPKRRERKATWAPDSSPVTYKVFQPLRCKPSIACNSKVDLPMPGSPPIKTTPPWTMPPPKTRSSSSWPVGVRGTSDASMSDKVATSAAGTNAAIPAYRFLTGPPDSTAPSMRVFHALQLGHLPSHLGLVPPHSVQVYWVLSLAIIQMILDKQTVFFSVRLVNF